MPRSQEALQLLTKWLFLLIIIIANVVASANSAAYESSSTRGCPTAPFRPNIAASKEAAKLKVLVPNITSFRQFVDCSDPENVRGFCIDVFEKALSIIGPSSSSTLSPNMSIHYTCFNFSSSPYASGPTYNDMIELVANGDYDAVIGDVTIGANRLSRVDFTPKYMESGVIILAKVVQEEFSPWFFFGFPFSLRLWCTIVGAFMLTGILVCCLERNDHPEFTQGPLSERLSNVIWFIVEALVLLERDSLRSGVARGLVLAWLFFVVLLNASYTAGLSSFLTVNSLSSPSQDLSSLKESGHNIGYRRGSIIKDYLIQRFHVPESKLVPIRMLPDFVSNLTKGPDHGGVIAIVDERAYANIILSSLHNCDFAITGPQLTQEGFGFGFNKDHNLEAAFSIALMNLIESGCLEELQENDGMSDTSKCSESNTPSSKVSWRSSISLFFPLLGSLTLCIIVYYVKRCFHRPRLHPKEDLRVMDDSFLYNGQPDLALTRRLQHGDIELQQYPYYF